MNSKSENFSQRNYSAEQLLAENMEAVSSLELIPYQPIVYAIPQEQRDLEMQMLKDATQFQPTLYKQINTLATRKQLTDYLNQIIDIEESAVSEATDKLTTENHQTVETLTAENRQTVNQLKTLIEQAGRAQEKFISDSLSLMSDARKQQHFMQEQLRKLAVRFIIAASASAAASSLVVCLLLLHWLT